MKLGLINSAWAQAGRDTAFGIRMTKEIGFDTIDVFADPLAALRRRAHRPIVLERSPRGAPAVVQLPGLPGRLVVVVGDEELEMAAGDLIALKEDSPHAVRAVEDGAFLLTIAWHGRSQECGATGQ